MKIKDLGSIVRVTVPAQEVNSFADSWPCSGFAFGDRASFDFERRNGDLVALAINGKEATPARIDETALSALCGDAKRFAFPNS